MAVWKWIVETAATWTAVGIWIRLLFSLAVGMFIGIDRGLKRRGAGIKTHVLVCLGSALVMLTNICSGHFHLQKRTWRGWARRLSAVSDF